MNCSRILRELITGYDLIFILEEEVIRLVRRFPSGKKGRDIYEEENDEGVAPDASDSSEVPDEAPEAGDEEPADHDEDEAPEDDETPDKEEQTGGDAPEAGDEAREDNEEQTGSGAPVPETPKKRTTRAKRAKKA